MNCIVFVNFFIEMSHEMVRQTFFFLYFYILAQNNLRIAKSLFMRVFNRALQ